MRVFVICPGPLTGGGDFVGNFNFTLDGAAAGSFQAPSPGGCPGYEYNQQVFQVSDLTQGSHTFTITNIDSGFPSDLLLDFAVVDNGPPPTTTSTPVPPTSLPVPLSSTEVEVDDTDPAWTYTGMLSWYPHPNQAHPRHRAVGCVLGSEYMPSVRSPTRSVPRFRQHLA